MHRFKKLSDHRYVGESQHRTKDQGEVGEEREKGRAHERTTGRCVATATLEAAHPRANQRHVLLCRVKPPQASILPTRPPHLSPLSLLPRREQGTNLEKIQKV